MNQNGQHAISGSKRQCSKFLPMAERACTNVGFQATDASDASVAGSITQSIEKIRRYTREKKAPWHTQLP
jgi:hypothetical protein